MIIFSWLTEAATVIDLYQSDLRRIPENFNRPGHVLIEVRGSEPHPKEFFSTHTTKGSRGPIRRFLDTYKEVFDTSYDVAPTWRFKEVLQRKQQSYKEEKFKVT